MRLGNGLINFFDTIMQHKNPEVYFLTKGIKLFSPKKKREKGGKEKKRRRRKEKKK
jgi:hypothetical protein